MEDLAITRRFSLASLTASLKISEKSIQYNKKTVYKRNQKKVAINYNLLARSRIWKVLSAMISKDILGPTSLGTKPPCSGHHHQAHTHHGKQRTESHVRTPRCSRWPRIERGPAEDMERKGRKGKGAKAERKGFTIPKRVCKPTLRLHTSLRPKNVHPNPRFSGFQWFSIDKKRPKSSFPPKKVPPNHRFSAKIGPQHNS